VALLPEPLVLYRVHAANTIRQDQATMLFEICWILAVHLPNYGLDCLTSGQQPLEKRVDQILHSIHTAQCDRVLSVMLLQKLHDHLDQALQLLEPDNPTRARYLQYIQQRVHDDPQVNSPRPSFPFGYLRSRLGRIRLGLERLFS